MSRFNRRRALARLAAASMVFAGSSGGGIDSFQLRSRLLSRLSDESELSDDATDLDERELSEADGRVSAPPSAAEIRDATFELLRSLARDASADVRAVAGNGLFRAMQLLPPVERLELACQWAMSEHWWERAAIGRALAGPVRVLVTDIVIEQLAHDSHPEVRAAALHAARAHVVEAPATYAPIVERLRSDEATTFALNGSRWIAYG